MSDIHFSLTFYFPFTLLRCEDAEQAAMMTTTDY